jgi:hypothetical protein
MPVNGIYRDDVPRAMITKKFTRRAASNACDNGGNNLLNFRVIPQFGERISQRAWRLTHLGNQITPASGNKKAGAPRAPASDRVFATGRKSWTVPCDQQE